MTQHDDAIERAVRPAEKERDTMHYLKNRILGVALSGATVGGLVLGCAVSASAGTVPSAGTTLGWVYTSTNSTAGNQVEVWSRQPGGALVLARTYNTGGTGNDINAISQGGVTLSPDHRTLLVVDGGSDQVSDFAVLPGGSLRLRNVVASGGTDPDSVAINGGLAEVLNAVGPDAVGTPNVTGFRATGNGLIPVAGGSQPLSSEAVAPTDVVISPDGRQVAVAELVSNTIDTFAVARGGALAPAVTSPSDSSAAAFGEVFSPSGRLFVANYGAADNSTVSSYQIAPSGALTAIQPPVSDGQSEACWIVLDRNGHAFVVNSSSGSISTLRVSPSGQVTFLRNTSIGEANPNATDEAVSSDGLNLYVIDANQNELHEFKIGHDGQLTAIGAQSVPAGSLGAAAS
jgi:6-phosphogluconolactonase